MTLKDSLFWLKLSLSSLAGLLAGVAGLSATEGLTLFFFTDIAAGTALLTWRREAVSEVGVYKAYREFFMTSFLAFFLLWTLSLNVAAGGVAIYLASPVEGVQELRPVVPRDGFPYNALWILNSTDETYTALVGSCAPMGEAANLENLTASAGPSGITLVVEAPVEEGSPTALGWANLTYENGTVTLRLPGDGGIELRVGEERTAELGGHPLRVRTSPAGPAAARVEVEVGPLPAQSSDLSGGPLGALVSRIFVEGDRYCVFEPGPATFKRTLRVDGAYVLIRG